MRAGESLSGWLNFLKAVRPIKQNEWLMAENPEMVGKIAAARRSWLSVCWCRILAEILNVRFPFVNSEGGENEQMGYPSQMKTRSRKGLSPSLFLDTPWSWEGQVADGAGAPGVQVGLMGVQRLSWKEGVHPSRDSRGGELGSKC